MTPAIRTLKKAKIKYTIHQYEHDPGCSSYGEEAARKLERDPSSVFKTLVAELDDGRLAVSVIPVMEKLNLKSLAKAFKAKKAKMAEKSHVERITGYLVGGVSPLGQKKRLATLIDNSAQQQKTICISGGRRGLDIELSPLDLQNLVQATFVSICK